MIALKALFAGSILTCALAIPADTQQEIGSQALTAHHASFTYWLLRRIELFPAERLAYVFHARVPEEAADQIPVLLDLVHGARDGGLDLLLGAQRLLPVERLEHGPHMLIWIQVRGVGG